MKGAILSAKSEKDLNLILQLAKKIGISTRKLSDQEIEDFGLTVAIEKGKTGQFVNTDSFLNEQTQINP
jgi:hypothetical protein